VVCLSQMTAKPGGWQDLNEPNSIIVYERFTSQEGLDAHVNSPYVQEFIHTPTPPASPPIGMQICVLYETFPAEFPIFQLVCE
jgi:hypothetical protein